MKVNKWLLLSLVALTVVSVGINVFFFSRPDHSTELSKKNDSLQTRLDGRQTFEDSLETVIALKDSQFTHIIIPSKPVFNAPQKADRTIGRDSLSHLLESILQ